MTAPHPAPRRPPGRYDEPRRSSRILVRLLAVVVGLAVAAGVYGFYQRYTEGRVSYQLRTFEVVSDSVVRITFEVRLDEGQRGECRVRARSRDGVERGSATIPVGPGRGGALVETYDLATTSRAGSGEVTSCRLLERP